MYSRESKPIYKPDNVSNTRESIMNLNEILQSSKLKDSLLNKTLLIEYKHLQKFCPSGVYIIPQFDDIKIWHGVLFVREGPYKDGILKFEITIPPEYPTIAPIVTFVTKVDHPLIDPSNGRLSIESKLDTWEAGKSFLIKIIYFIQEIFYSPSLVGDSNKMKSSEEIAASTQQSITECFENKNDKSSIKFSQFNRYHQLILDKILKQNKDVNTYDRIEDFKNWFMNNFMEIVQNNETKK